MPLEAAALEALVQRIVEAAARPFDSLAVPSADLSMRERFAELVVLSLANLYAKTPIASSLFDRSMAKTVSAGLEDNDAGKLSNKTEDWIRLEGLVRVQEGQKSYTLNRPSLAVLSTMTHAGTLGEVSEKIAAAYAGSGPSQELRLLTRQLFSYLMTRLGRS